MSEIFNRLKRTEFEKHDKSLDPPISPEIVFPIGSNGDREESIPPPKYSDPEPSADFAPARVEFQSTAALDLALADQRVKDVWDPLTLVGEQFRILRAKLSVLQKQRGSKTLLITSAAPCEGKTFVACGLAGVLGQEPGKRVLLVDADLRRPQAAKDLGMNHGGDEPGLSDVLNGEMEAADALISSTDANLFFLPAGKEVTNPSELLSSPRLSRSIKQLSERFDWVIVDSPPAISLADTCVIAPVCDAVLLVIHSNHTPSKLIKDCIQRLGRDRIVGVVMNRMKHVKSSKYYYSYYHHHSGRQRPELSEKT